MNKESMCFNRNVTFYVIVKSKSDLKCNFFKNETCLIPISILIVFLFTSVDLGVRAAPSLYRDKSKIVKKKTY